MTAFKIQTIKAFIATNDDGTEGVISMQIGDVHMPFVCADDKRVKDLKPHAIKIAKETGKTVKLAKFSVRENIESYD